MPISKKNTVCQKCVFLNWRKLCNITLYFVHVSLSRHKVQENRQQGGKTKKNVILISEKQLFEKGNYKKSFLCCVCVG